MPAGRTSHRPSSVVRARAVFKQLPNGLLMDRNGWWIEFGYETNRRQVRRCVISLQTILEHYGRFPDFCGRILPQLLELTGSAYPKVRWSARRALRSRGGVGRFERGLVSRRAREAEKRDGEVRFSVRPCLPELELSALSFILHPPSVPLEYRGMIARHIESRYFIATTTRHSLTLPPGTSRSLCPRSLEPAEDKDRASRSRRGASLCSSTGADGMPPCSNEWP